MDKLIKFAQGLRVLYVEDNKEARESTLGLLENIFDNITTAVNGEDGLEKFEKGSFDLILTDINMPKMNGMEMIDKIRETDKDVPILILSAYNESGYFIETIRQGVEGYLLKPIDLDQFLDMIKKAVEKIYLKKELEIYQNSLEKKVQEQTEELYRQLYYDSLTSLENRNSLLKVIKKEKPFGLMLIDINNFSAFNDIYGFDVGDEILKNVSKLLLKLAKDQYRVFRVGGNQFVFLDMKDDHHNFTQNIVSNILNEIENTIIVANEGTIKINIAVTVSVVSNCETEKIFKNAQIALHYAKKTNQYIIFYTDELNLDKFYKKELEAVVLVKNALAEDRVIPVFQKIKKSQKYETYECLVRIKQDGKLISPFVFLDAIKRTKYYTELTKTMIRKSFEKFKDTDTHFSINLSFEDISNKSLVSFIEEILKQTNMAHQLIIEIVESDSIDNFMIVKDFIKKMQNLGVKISIDDFGSGYSNFSHILELNPDTIKVDGSLIKNICEDKKSYIIVKTIVNFAKELGIDTVVEYVHSHEVMEKTKELNVDGFQGYFIAEPSERI